MSDVHDAEAGFLSLMGEIEHTASVGNCWMARPSPPSPLPLRLLCPTSETFCASAVGCALASELKERNTKLPTKINKTFLTMRAILLTIAPHGRNR